MPEPIIANWLCLSNLGSRAWWSFLIIIVFFFFNAFIVTIFIAIDKYITEPNWYWILNVFCLFVHLCCWLNHFDYCIQILWLLKIISGLFLFIYINNYNDDDDYYFYYNWYYNINVNLLLFNVLYNIIFSVV